MSRKKGGMIKLSGAYITATATVVGKKEHEGKMGDCFDLFDLEDRFGQKTWEKSESEMQRMALSCALGKAKLTEDDIGALFAGDLLNQCVGSAYGLVDFDLPYFGLYGACSTAAEGIILSALAVNAGYFKYAAAVTSSHNASAERQFRNPLEYGGQRPPTAQWTVTGSGAFIISDKSGVDGAFCEVVDVMPGVVVEKGIKDANNMGAAMAPAATDTILRYLTENEKKPSDFDLILTGDLGEEGRKIMLDLLSASGVDISDEKIFEDCGRLIYDIDAQDVHCGGSGCGCSAVVVGAYILPKLRSGELSDVLFIGTGAMMSPSSSKQGEAIPAIGHLVHLGSVKKQ